MTADIARGQLLALVLLSALLMGLNLGSNSLHNQDEATHAVVAREAATDGHWLPLTYNGEPYLKKPPLRIWLTALTYKFGGINEWTVRLWSAVAGFGTVLMLYFAGRRLYGERTAFWSSLILLTSHQYLYNHCVRTGETDSLLIFCWTGGLLLLQLAVEEANRKLLYVAATLVGMCGMVKHLGFVPIVLSIAGGYVLMAGVWRAFSWRTWSLGLGIVCAVALPWHLLTWSLEGRVFPEKYFFGEIVEERLKAAGGGPRAWRRGPWSSIMTLARGFFPWSYLVPFALGWVVVRPEFRRRWSLPCLWLLVAIATTVVSGRKFSWYVLPAFPAAAILVAALIDRFLDDRRGALMRISVAMGGLLALASTTNAAYHNPFEVMARQAMLAVRFLGRVRGPTVPLPAALALAMVVVAGAALAYWLLGRFDHSGQPRRLVRTLLVATIFSLALYTVALPLKFSRTISPVDAISQATEEHLSADETLIVRLPRRKVRHPIFRFYFGGKNLKVVRSREWRPDGLSGQLLLTDVATLDEIRATSPELKLPERPLARARGLLLLRLPED